LLIVCALLLVGSAWAAPSTTDITWKVLGGGGGRVTSGSVALDGTIGQPVTGAVSQPSLALCSGYWCDTEVSVRQIFLPLVRR